MRIRNIAKDDRFPVKEKKRLHFPMTTGDRCRDLPPWTDLDPVLFSVNSSDCTLCGRSEFRIERQLRNSPPRPSPETQLAQIRQKLLTVRIAPVAPTLATFESQFALSCQVKRQIHI